MTPRRSKQMLKGALAALLLALFLSYSFPAQSCEYPVSQEYKAWVAKGLTVQEIRNVSLFMAEFESRIGETTEADQVFVLSKEGFDQVLVIFAVKGCVTAMAPLSVKAFNRIALGLPA